jgi:hypothetical protein
MKKIKDFIKAFKQAYYEVNKNKIDAKNAIDNYRKDTEVVKEVAEELKLIHAKLESVYHCLPIKERQNFIQKTLDLLKYGRINGSGGFMDEGGYCEIYNLQYKHMKDDLYAMNVLYGNERYDEVIKYVEKCNKNIENFGIKHGLVDDTRK